VPVLVASRARFPFGARVYADSAYAGQKVAQATRIAVHNVRAEPGQVGFAVQPRRWVVERLFAWINRSRRLAKTSKQPSPQPTPSSTPLPSCC
jgi:putative transposase